ncbi:arsenate reductase family protein [Alkalibacillus salilacus]|uniref:Arsenate reductase n=1 Tax=Alkalibacillus salilacus TaxID=284582 RepID=A0ABT9VF15_9BACI|nr:arsenate reductase family protein [Alkalibacillus salilacus]MDQ0159539.1 arsenate reductase [Alkalibacillus salilacus]
MSLTVYQYPKCGTCRKALKWLDEHNLEYDSVHIVDNPPNQTELKQIIERSDLPTKKFFNTSGKKYRELNLKERLPSMSEDEQIELLASDGMLIKRPIVTDGEHVTVGFNEDTFEEIWNS